MIRLRAKHKTKTALAVEALKDAIIRNELNPGQELTVGRLSKMLGMSATPVREALRILQAEGYISGKPYGRASVATLSPSDLHEVYGLRSLLEGFATKLAVEHLRDSGIALRDTDLEKFQKLHEEMIDARDKGDAVRLQKANTDWHFGVYEAANARFVMEFVKRLWAAFEWEAIWMVPGRVDQSIAEHERILEAIKRNAADEAAELMQRHIRSSEQSVLVTEDMMRGQLDPSKPRKKTRAETNRKRPPLSARGLPIPAYRTSPLPHLDERSNGRLSPSTEATQEADI
jgi:DNA-binding GntR family transcriptional regulator